MAIVTYNAAIVLSLSRPVLNLESLLAISDKIRTNALECIRMIVEAENESHLIIENGDHWSPTYHPMGQDSVKLKLLFKASFEIVDAPVTMEIINHSIETHGLNIELTGLEDIDESIEIAYDEIFDCFPLPIPELSAVWKNNTDSSPIVAPIYPDFDSDSDYQHLARQSLFYHPPVTHTVEPGKVEQLQIAMLESDIPSIIQILVENPQLIDAPVLFGITPLKQAIIARNEPVACILIEFGANPLIASNQEEVDFISQILKQITTQQPIAESSTPFNP